ncbi:NAD-dependent epimerase/dehydratase family protein [Paenibacillus sp. MMS18-CY102]|uniref:NAD-dependent epimerase/dehydratase family protein n=1 Tax=Paenibacillus sp. MMS18-CY102 TaxID=2682849 RepID=UPI00136526A2|nr:NAD-dependent epimerase/dehydratase family protein [Paenibacillus sp. MMS18-CY102]MWC30212.1 NAD-dependent epimerase/dehydratase family protein [Paenibacillus sp. MMS18-CY102]
MKIVMIGGTSFIGPHVVKQLAGMGHHDITLFHRGQTKCELPANVKHIFGEKMQLEQFRDEFKSLSPDVVVDMIASTEEDTRAVARAFEGIAARLITISSQDVYRAYGIVRKADQGPLEPTPITESSALRLNRFPYQDPAKDPNDWCNKYDKILVEDIVMNNQHMQGTILRLPAVYGPHDPLQRFYKYLKLKPISDSRPFVLVEESFSNWRWTHSFVENVAYAIALAITNERSAGRIYNVGELHAHSMLDYINEIGSILNWKGQVIVAPNGSLPEEMKVPFNTEQPLLVDSQRIREELGFVEQCSFSDGCIQTVKWELANQPDEAVDYGKEDEILRHLGQLK